MQLDSLLRDLPGISVPVLAAMSVTGITTDPNLCQPGFIYVAAVSETVDSKRYGVRLDGRDYIDKAIENGARLIISAPGTILSSSKAVLIEHPSPLLLLGPLAARFYGQLHPKNIALVTGTNGKTSTVNFCRLLWASLGFPSCSIGNLGGVCSDGTEVWGRDPVLSVPETVELHKIFHRLAEKNIDHVAMEATSHSLFDYRLHGVKATVGAFTNLTRDHLDFHGSMEEYFRVKMTLFKDVLPAGGTAILNADSSWFEPAQNICRNAHHRLISFGQNGADIRLLERKNEKDGQVLRLEIFGKTYQCKLNLFGEFQAENVLCSLAIVLASGLDVDSALEKLNSLTPIEGRLEVVAVTPTGGKVVVDYAHTPDGIRAALEACRTFTSGKLISVFGCNGERDSGKRPLMGEIAASLADLVVVTDNHPRTEDPAVIRRQILAGAPAACEIADRVSAIEFVIRELKKGDTALIAGMGHEKFQTIGKERQPYSDKETVIGVVGKLGERSL
ncbi:MAG: UDP-N-acetylmuramoyl-L-alanyl-D-glutamate--2,6-diaminopimelate ligase [Candidatus Obscuribacterales bacterium]|jgi:UDP-N-acetylmuramoyl-L-alanyl-D-glutamate--2,6-diaminopimelate ligase|nr:UDP-N-acetylmuramoyl-L-alanyl-D-glutamate--2,6-diaminopimelate ligase [Candidatus Obscuribacterales bacterium]